MKSVFPLLNKLIQFLSPLKIKWFVSGGWAVNNHVGSVTGKNYEEFK